MLGSGTQGLAIIKDLFIAGHKVFLLGSKHNYADASRYISVKQFYDTSPLSEDFYQRVIDMVQTYKISTIIPMGDVLTEFMCRYKERLLQYVRFKIPDFKDFDRGCNKGKLMNLCKDKGYPHPVTFYSLDEIEHLDKNSNPFPILIKPNITCGGRGMTLVNSYEELTDKLPQIQAEYGTCHLQKYVKQGGAQVEVQLYVDENKRLVNSSVIYKYRWYPEKGGSSCCAKSVKNDKIVDILYHLLLDLNWVGFADFDTIEDPVTGELLIMELNPRVPACVKCVIEAGVHWGEIIVNDYLGNPQKNYEYKEGEFLRHLGFETLWFLKSPNRFKTKPNWFKLIGPHIHYQDMSDWTDPLPFLIGTLHNVKKILNHKEKEKIKR